MLEIKVNVLEKTTADNPANINISNVTNSNSAEKPILFMGLLKNAASFILKAICASKLNILVNFKNTTVYIDANIP